MNFFESLNHGIMKLEARKMELIEGLLLIQDKGRLEEIGKMIKASISIPKKKSFESSKASFDEWNSQFKTSKFDLNEKIPGFGLTLLEFRKKIFNAEANENNIDFNQFKKELKLWKNKKSIR
ncbi:MAG: hypothetical protein IPG24_06360 [Leptospiraceae bacterium]|nr:hypothetical protein [Leptospiraceae bacterium]